MRTWLPAMLLGTVFVSGCASQAGYLLKQGSALLRDSSGARPVQSLLEDASTPADTRAFLLRVQDIRRFAVEHVGLKVNDNYTRYKDLGRGHLVDVVQACDAASFQPYQWDYPFLGKLPYRGYYDAADAKAEAARLRKEGYDVIVRPVDAFSTLGFLRDPLYSFMKGYSPFEIASLIIHEQTHATLFLKGQPDFNEEMATFVGDEGAFQWLRATYGQDSAEYRQAVDARDDSQLFVTLLQRLAARLEPVYASSLDRSEKIAEKQEIIAEFKAGLADARAAGFRTEDYSHLDTLPLNNAYLSLYRLYTSDVPLLRRWFTERCGSDLPRFMASMRELAAHGDVKAQIRAALGPA
ncbi:MAG TPA: aminopeptidase [Spirochaetia bacterium]|nr:aminopeptidase [Spirochaetia bacterium]